MEKALERVPQEIVPVGLTHAADSHMRPVTKGAWPPRKTGARQRILCSVLKNNPTSIFIISSFYSSSSSSLIHLFNTNLNLSRGPAL